MLDIPSGNLSAAEAESNLNNLTPMTAGVNLINEGINLITEGANILNIPEQIIERGNQTTVLDTLPGNLSVPEGANNLNIPEQTTEGGIS